MNQINDWVKQLLGTWAQKRVAKNGSFLGCIMKELFREMPITTTRELDSYDRITLVMTRPKSMLEEPHCNVSFGFGSLCRQKEYQL